MTEKIYEFNELDPKFWKLWTGPGYTTIYEVSEGKFKFRTACFADQRTYLILRTSRPYSFINNTFSLDFGVTRDSCGSVLICFSPQYTEAGEMPFVLQDTDSLFYYKCNGETEAAFMRVRGGALQFSASQYLPEDKLSGTLKFEDTQGKLNLYIDDLLIASVSEEFKYGYIYICLEAMLDPHVCNRKLEGWIDNFKIGNYEAACINPELATLLPTLNSMTAATLSLVTVLSIVGMIKGVMK